MRDETSGKEVVMRMLIAAIALAVMLFVARGTDAPHETAETETLLMVDAECPCGASIEDARAFYYEVETLMVEGEVRGRAAEATGSAESIVTDNYCTHGDRCSHGLTVRHTKLPDHAGRSGTRNMIDAARTAIARGALRVGVRS